MFYFDKDIKFERVDDNTLRKILAYDGGLMDTLCVFEKGLAPDSTIPYHKHANEQTTYVLKGSFKFSIKYPDHVDTQTVHEGDSMYFPSNYEHGCIPLEDDSRVLDSFTPIRKDFL